MSRRPSYLVRAAVFSALFSLFPAGPARSADFFELTPTFKLIGNHNDNLDFNASEEVSDYYAEISPGLGMRLDLSEIEIEASYFYTRYQYREESSYNRDYHNLLVSAPYGIHLSRNLSIQIQDKYELVPINVTLPEDQTDNLTQRNTFTVGPVWESRLARRLRLLAGYEFSRVDYTSSGRIGDDYFGHRFYESLNYQFSRSWNCFQRNSYLLHYYSHSPDYQRFLPEAGLGVTIGKRVILSGSWGYSFEKTGDDEHDGYVLTLNGSWAATQKLDLEATLRHRRTVDIQGEPYTEQYGELLCRYRATKRLLLETYGRYYDDTYQDNDYRRVQFKAGLLYRLNQWSSLNCGYVRNQTVDTPPDEKAVSNRYYAGVNISFGTI